MDKDKTLSRTAPLLVEIAAQVALALAIGLSVSVVLAGGVLLFAAAAPS